MDGEFCFETWERLHVQCLIQMPIVYQNRVVPVHVIETPVRVPYSRLLARCPVCVCVFLSAKKRPEA